MTANVVFHFCDHRGRVDPRLLLVGGSRNTSLPICLRGQADRSATPNDFALTFGDCETIGLCRMPERMGYLLHCSGRGACRMTDDVSTYQLNHSNMVAQEHLPKTLTQWNTDHSVTRLLAHRVSVSVLLCWITPCLRVHRPEVHLKILLESRLHAWGSIWQYYTVASG